MSARPSQATEPFLTDRRRAILAALDEFTSEKGFAPTLRELGETIGQHSTSVVSWHLHQLSRAGYLITPTDAHGTLLARTMRLTPKGADVAGEPRSLDALDGCRRAPRN